ncbi:TetR family transcriptional regulator [Streptomyces sp. CC53]|uniref:TetR/AcrR family transcriptional regulator n=1 Tax=unclassified Streptomyces TaxID=2593676 RepID=UPI0008DC64DB|nr:MULTISPECIES: TetR family transcriptional regulator [unclassified Streptomyces]OII64964.1 TetR family transcriptional regulator [Streptomyces sp. CC53]
MARMPAAERRRQLVEAAIRVMTRDGVARATTRSIAAEAGVSLSVFHYCFASKQDLFESVVETITEHSVAGVDPSVALEGTVRDTVRAGLRAYWDHVVTHPGEHMLTYELTQYALRRPGFEHLARRQYERYAAAHVQLVERLRDSAGLELLVPAATLARYLAVVTDGLTLNHLVLGDPERAEELLDVIADQCAALVRRPPRP